MLNDLVVYGMLTPMHPSMLVRECPRCRRQCWVMPEFAASAVHLCELCHYRAGLETPDQKRRRGRGRRVEACVETILTYMHASEWTGWGHERVHRVLPRHFDHAEPMFGGEEGDSAADSAICYPTSTPLEWLGRPLDTRIITTMGAGDYRTGFTLQRMRWVHAREVRGRVHRWKPNNFEYLVAKVFPETARVETTRYWLGEDADGTVADNSADTFRLKASGYKYGNVGAVYELGRVELPGNESPVPAKDYDTVLHLMIAIQYVQRFQWRVYLSYVGLPGVELATDPVGAMAVFRLRDIPNGAARRAALRTWITEHWRSNIRDRAEEIMVRQHLRGAQQFTWNGLRCTITPSVVDLDLNEQLIEEREVARDLGTDRRPASAH